MSEEKLQEFAARLRAVQTQANGIAQQLAVLQASVAEHERAVATLEEAQKLSKGGEVLVPVGAGTYLFATLARADRVLSDLGAGVSAERSPGSALEALGRRKEELEAVHRRLAEGLARLEDEEERLQAELAALVQQKEQE